MFGSQVTVQSYPRRISLRAAFVGTDQVLLESFSMLRNFDSVDSAERGAESLRIREGLFGHLCHEIFQGSLHGFDFSVESGHLVLENFDDHLLRDSLAVHEHAVVGLWVVAEGSSEALLIVSRVEHVWKNLKLYQNNGVMEINNSKGCCSLYYLAFLIIRE